MNRGVAPASRSSPPSVNVAGMPLAALGWMTPLMLAVPALVPLPPTVVPAALVSVPDSTPFTSSVPVFTTARPLKLLEAVSVTTSLPFCVSVPPPVTVLGTSVLLLWLKTRFPLSVIVPVTGKFPLVLPLPNWIAPALMVMFPTKSLFPAFATVSVPLPYFVRPAPPEILPVPVRI